jgi:DNA-binding MarR family transcriptional regulator
MLQYAALAEFHEQLQQCLMASESRAKEAGLRLPEYQVMLAIKANAGGNAATLASLTAWLQFDRATVVELVDGLVRRGFVKRERDAADRRRVLISLTPTGEQWLEPLAHDVMRNLTTNGMKLFKALRVMLANAAAVAAHPPAPARAELDLQAWRAAAPPVI